MANECTCFGDSTGNETSDHYDITHILFSLTIEIFGRKKSTLLIGAFESPPQFFFSVKIIWRRVHNMRNEVLKWNLNLVPSIHSEISKKHSSSFTNIAPLRMDSWHETWSVASI